MSDTPGTLFRWIRPKVRRLSAEVLPPPEATPPTTADHPRSGDADAPGPLDRAPPVVERCPVPHPPADSRAPSGRPAERCRVCPPKPVNHTPPPALGPSPGTGHHTLHWGKAEWCAQCGRVTEAGPAGRAQQWRGPCHPLPSFIAKQQRGHRLVFAGHWQCLACPCPPERLYRTKCERARGNIQAPSDSPPRPHLQGSRDPSFRRFVVGEPSLHATSRADPRSHRPKATTIAQGSAHGDLSIGQAAPVVVTGTPIQSQITRFFPDAKRPRLMPIGQRSLPQATGRPPRLSRRAGHCRALFRTPVGGALFQPSAASSRNAKTRNVCVCGDAVCVCVCVCGP